MASFTQKISTNQLKLIHSLNHKKYRQKYNLFVVENAKIIKEIKNTNYFIEKIYSIEETAYLFPPEITNIISKEELKKISFLQNPQDALAIVKIPNISVPIDLDSIIIGLENIQDPGNLGTIIRIADWFNIPQIICSNNSVDIYNPKVIQASMGSFLRVQVFYVSFLEFIQSYPHSKYIADMTGKNIYTQEFEKQSLIIFGNEGNGISQELKTLNLNQITIPRFGEAESLNIAVSTGIIISEIKRRKAN